MSPCRLESVLRFIHPSIHSSIHPSLYPTTHPPNNSFTHFHLFISPSFQTTLYDTSNIHLSIHPSISSSTHPTSIHSFHVIHVSIYSSIHPPAMIVHFAAHLEGQLLITGRRTVIIHKKTRKKSYFNSLNRDLKTRITN